MRGVLLATDKIKKGYYIYVENCGSSGVMNKIKMQMDTFSKHLDIKSIQIPNKKCSIVRKVYNMFPWASFEREYGDVLEQMNNPDFVYIRRTYIDKDYLAFLREIHARWSACKIIVEQPVYPYDRDMLRSPYTAIQYIKELLLRKHYKDDIDRFVTYSDDDDILGVKTIRTMNGVNVSEMRMIHNDKKFDSEGINLITVATLVAHHGYERIIEGLHQYYQNGGERNIVFHIVGDGPEKKRYTDMVKKYNLEAHVVFYGAKYGEELDQIYDLADAGLAAFGSYKEGVDKLCTIKVREYFAKGLPVVLGCEDNLFRGEAKQFGLILPNDSSAIDISKVLSFLDSIYTDKTRNEVTNCIVELAQRTVDNEVTLRPVIEYIYS